MLLVNKPILGKLADSLYYISVADSMQQFNVIAPLRRSRSFKVTDLVPIESPYKTLTYILFCAVSMLLQIIGHHFFAFDSGYLSSSHLFGVNP